MHDTEAREPGRRPDAKVAVVLTGAVGRGAFQAGALGAVLTTLDQELGLEPSVLIGTSAGAVNAVLWADAAYRLGPGADAALIAKDLHSTWVSMNAEQVYEAPLSWRPEVMRRSAARVGWPVVRGFLFGGGPGIGSLLDTTPLHETAKRIFPATLSLPEPLDAVGVVATWIPPGETDGSVSGRSTLFLKERTRSEWAGSPENALDVERGPILPAHVLASSAVPGGFPAQHVSGSGWYSDGGVRLNTPLLPAIELGATHLVVISAMSLRYPRRRPREAFPSVLDAGSQVQHAVIADRTVEDLLTLESTNRSLRHAGAKVELRNRRGRPYRKIPALVVAPSPGKLRHLADLWWHRKYASLAALATLKDNAVMGRLLRTGGDGPGWQELLSYLMFDEDYFRASYHAGVTAARAALAAVPRTESTWPWQLENLVE